MIRTNLLTDSPVRKIVDKRGPFDLIEYSRDVSLDNPAEAVAGYFAAQMNLRRRQILCRLDGGGVILQAGAMQMMIGNVTAQTNLKGTGDFVRKLIGSKVTGESAVKPRYTGKGLLLTEPTFRHIIFEDLSDWGGKIVLEDGIFLACEDTIDMKVTSRSSISSAVAGGEGHFNTALVGDGVAVLESPVPQAELVYVDLEEDTLKVDGNFALAWSDSLDFTVERSAKTLAGSAATGEGLVNVYRGSGRVMLAPVMKGQGL